MSIESRKNLKTIGWTLGAAVAALVLHAQGGDARAHVMSGASSDWCSPHHASGSKGGSVFVVCSFNTSTGTGMRQFNCNGGTPCSNDLCGGAFVYGHSTSWGSSSHGKAGGHSPYIDMYYCY